MNKSADFAPTILESELIAIALKAQVVLWYVQTVEVDKGAAVANYGLVEVLRVALQSPLQILAGGAAQINVAAAFQLLQRREASSRVC